MKADDPRTWMWTRALKVLEEAECLQKQFFHLGRSPSQRPAWEPPVDIYASNGALHIVVALPGVSQDCLKVRSKENVLVISGDRPSLGKATSTPSNVWKSPMAISNAGSKASHQGSSPPGANSATAVCSSPSEWWNTHEHEP